MRGIVCLLAWLCLVACDSAAAADSKTVRLGTSTSVKDSGLLDRLTPAFEKDTGYRLQAFTPGSGKAIQLAREGVSTCCWCMRPRPSRSSSPRGMWGGAFRT